MSNFDETMLKRVKALEREVERLKVKESPIMSNYLLATGKAADSDKLDGIDSTGFATAGHDHSGVYLPVSGKAADADKLDGIDSTGFVQTSGNQTVAGVKTFSSIPVLPATNPTTANQAVRKGYADATYLGITAKAADSDKLDGLDSTDFGRPVFRTTPLTSTSWDGDSFSTTGKTLIDLSAVFGVPAGVKAVLVQVTIRDSGSNAADYAGTVILSPNSTNYSGQYVSAGGLPADYRRWSMLLIPCDANGDIYYQLIASGTGTSDIWLDIWGYWL